MEDDMYNGYVLPKGSWVIGNIWLVPNSMYCPLWRHTS